MAGGGGPVFEQCCGSTSTASDTLWWYLAPWQVAAGGHRGCWRAGLGGRAGRREAARGRVGKRRAVRPSAEWKVWWVTGDG